MFGLLALFVEFVHSRKFLKTIDTHGRAYLQSVFSVHLYARREVASHINATMTRTYWQIGKYIVEYEQGGQAKVAYGASFCLRWEKGSLL